MGEMPQTWAGMGESVRGLGSSQWQQLGMAAVAREVGCACGFQDHAAVVVRTGEWGRTPAFTEPWRVAARTTGAHKLRSFCNEISQSAWALGHPDGQHQQPAAWVRLANAATHLSISASLQFSQELEGNHGEEVEPIRWVRTRCGPHRISGRAVCANTKYPMRRSGPDIQRHLRSAWNMSGPWKQGDRRVSVQVRASSASRSAAVPANWRRDI